MEELKRDLKSFKFKTNAPDWLFIGASTLYVLFVIAVFIGFLSFLLGGCVAPEEEIIPAVTESLDSPKAHTSPQRSLESLYTEHFYINVVEGGEGASQARCIMLGETMKLQFKGLHTKYPYLVGRERIPCNTISETYNNWSLSCTEYIQDELIWYWIHYDVHLDRLGWDNKEYVGWAFWTIDVGEYFWCTMTFRTILIEPEYIWQ